MKLLGFTAFRHAAAGASKQVVAKSLADLALIGTGVTMAAGSVVFATMMLTQGDHGPNVNGMQYLAIFAKPGGAVHPIVADARPAAAAPSAASPPPAVAAVPSESPRVAGSGLDMAPTGSIPRTQAGPGAGGAFRILAVEPGIAWLTNGSEIVAVKPGDVAPGLGRVATIEKREGRWVLLDDSGSPLLTGDASQRKGGSMLFDRRMIFGPSP